MFQQREWGGRSAGAQADQLHACQVPHVPNSIVNASRKSYFTTTIFLVPKFFFEEKKFSCSVDRSGRRREVARDTFTTTTHVHKRPGGQSRRALLRSHGDEHMCLLACRIRSNKLPQGLLVQRWPRESRALALAVRITRTRISCLWPTQSCAQAVCFFLSKFEHILCMLASAKSCKHSFTTRVCL